MAFSHTLQSSDQIISSGDVIGRLAYAASNEASAGDAVLIAGMIESMAEGDFTAVANPASLVFSTSTSAAASEQMRLTSEGYLGINTEYPTSQLHVSGDARVDSMGINTAPSTTHNLKVVDSKILGGIIVEGASFPGYSIETNGVNSGMYANSSGQLLFNADFGSSNSSAAVQLSVQNTVRLEVDTTGVTINSEYKLPLTDGTSGQVIKTDGNGNLSFQDDTTGSLSGAGVANYVARWSDADTLTTGVIQDDGTAASVNREAGPTSRKLTVTGGTGDNSAAVLIQASGHNATGSDGFLLSHSNSATAYVWNFENGDMILATNNSEAIRIDTDRNVGIGTTSPSYKLDVNGDARILGIRPTIISAGSSYATTKQASVGGWSFGHHAIGSSGTDLGGFGWFGTDDAITRYYMGPDYLSTDGIHITSLGNVGIGTASPLYKLDVTNNARVGEIIIGDTAYSVSSAYQGITHNTWAGDNQGYMMISDGNDTLVSSNRNTVIRCNVNDGTSQMQVTPILTQLRQDNNYVAFRNGSTKFNENSNNVDFMVHGDTRLNMIYVDASADQVGIGTSTPTELLTVNGGLENLYGWKWFASLGNTLGQGPASGFLLQLNEEYGNILSKAYHYIVRLSTNSTGTDTGASYLIWWSNATALWEIRPIGQANNVSNHPMVEITNDGTYDKVRVYTDNATPYPIRCQVESLFHGDLDCKPHSMGADYHWQRLIDDLYYTDGNVYIANDIVVSGDITSIGNINFGDNLSICHLEDVCDITFNNSIGSAGSINKIQFYDNGTHAAGVGVSSGSVDYIAEGSVVQSFYTGGVRSLRLDPSGKVVMGAGANVVAGDASLNYNVGICTNAATNAAIQVLKVAPATGLSTFFNQYNRLTVPSGDLTAIRGVYQDMIVQDGADLSNMYGYTTGTNTVNAGGNVDTVIGYYVNNVFLRGSASNYGIYSDVNEEETGYANKWGLFLAGTAPNYYRSGLKTSLLEGRHGSDNLCERVAGGYKALGNTATNAGYLKIRLPEYLPEQKAGSTMLMFDVSVYEYKTGGYKNFHFGGYVYWNTSVLKSQWINTTATMEVDRDIDNANPWVVRFAIDEDDYPCVLIGRSGENEATNWQYGQVYLQNVRTGFGRTTWDQWSQNWEISLETRDTTTGGYYNIASGFINKPLMQNQVDYSITAGGTDLSSPTLNKIIIDGNQTVFNENGINADFRVESDTNQHMIFVDASADSVGVGLSNPRTDAQLHVGGPIANPTLMIGTGGNIASSVCSLKFQDRGPASDQDADGQITGYLQMERETSTQFFDMTFGTVGTTAGDAVERMRIDRNGLVGIGTNAPSKLLHVDNSGNGAGTSVLIQGDDDSYLSVQNSTTGDFLKLGNILSNNNYMGLSHSDINNAGYMIMSDGADTFVGANSSGKVYIRGGKNDTSKGEIRVGEQLVQINPTMQNVDLIVYGDSVSQLFRTDASKDSILIGNSTDGGVNSRLYVYDDGVAKTNVTNSRTVQVLGRAYTTQSGTHYHIGVLSRAEKFLSGGSTDAGYVIGINAVPVVFSNSDDGTNSLTEMTAVRANMSINATLADGVNITNAFDIKCIPSLTGTNNTVTNHYGIYLTSATNGTTTVTNAYGVFQEDGGASNRFAGNMTIGSTVAPDSFDGLTVYGNVSTKRTDGKFMAKDGAVVSKLQASVGAGGGLIGTESNHNLLIRTNNIDIARFMASDGAFQLGRSSTGFATPQALLDVRGSAYFETSTDSEALTFKNIPGAGPFGPRALQEFQVSTLDNSTYLYHLENAASTGDANNITRTSAIRMTDGKVSINAPPVTGLGTTHFPKFEVDTSNGAVKINDSYILPLDDGESGYVIDTDGNGNLSWRNPATADIIFLTSGQSELDCSKVFFDKGIDGNVTFTTSNVPSDTAYMMTLKLHVVSGSVTWFDNIYWPNDTAPSLTVGKTHIFSILTTSGGATWYGSSLEDYNTLEGF